MSTVVAVNPIVTAFQKRSFPSSAPQVIKENLSRALTKMSTPMGCYCSSVSKLLAYNIRIIQVPVIITYSVPLSVVHNLNSSLSWCAPTNQSNRATVDTYSKSILASTARNCKNMRITSIIWNSYRCLELHVKDINVKGFSEHTHIYVACVGYSHTIVILRSLSTPQYTMSAWYCAVYKDLLSSFMSKFSQS